ncbi:MAG: ABC transporter ATP-binding protein [Patescibacteria group bacterium]|nr:ABC transporter ATP-binding protein [Patescibacteria group bacterium]
MSENIAISVKNVSKTFRIPHEKISSLRGAFVSMFRSNGYEEFKALDGVSFEVKKGEFFGIIGRNGSGKSTLLKILAGIYQSDGGSVKINGRISPFLELGIGFNPELSGRDNIYLNAAVLGLTHKQIDEKFDDIVRFSELRRFIDQKVKNYSSGMQVRLAFSVAIHANRDILLMDEVLAVGDVNFQKKCMDEFNRYHQIGRTVILVTHDINIVERYCDRAMLLRNGKIEIIGRPKEVCGKYIFQNMSDEEKRVLAEEELMRKKKEEEEKKEKERKQNTIHGIPVQKKVAEVSGIKFLDESGNSRNIFKTGEKINILVKYLIHKKVANPIMGITIRDIKDNLVFITNTDFKGIRTKIMEVGSAEVEFAIENHFAEGVFYVSPAIASEGAKVFYDWKDNMKSLKIVNGEYISGGLVDFKHSINIRRK